MKTLPITTIIIDDETPARDLIRHYLQDYPDIRIIAEAENGFEAMKAIREHHPQLMFLDIQMPKLTGFEMLELIEERPEIIFSTAYDQFAIKAFELNAVDYLLKPYSKQRFDAAVQKVLNDVRASGAPSGNPQSLLQTIDGTSGVLTRIAVKDRQQIHVIPIHEINYIEAYDDYVKLHTFKGTFLKEKTMKYLEENLPSQQFIRVHRSFIVNTDEIARIERYEKETFRVYLKNGEILKASSVGYKALIGFLRK